MKTMTKRQTHLASPSLSLSLGSAKDVTLVGTPLQTPGSLNSLDEQPRTGEHRGPPLLVFFVLPDFDRLSGYHYVHMHCDMYAIKYGKSMVLSRLIKNLLTSWLIGHKMNFSLM